MKKVISVLKEYVIIAAGLFIFALGWTAFIIPSEITGGGVSGIGTLIFYATGGKIPVGVSYLVINIGLLLVAIKVLGKSFGIKTVFAIVVASFFFTLLQQWIKEPIITEKFMAAIIGAIMSGAGIGMTFSQGGSSGGTDILALMINRKRNISPGRLILYFDVIIIASSYLVLTDLEPIQRIQAIVYGYVSMAVTAYTIDLSISGAKQSLQMFIFSDHPEEIANKIVKEANRGVTLIDGKGWYSNKNQKILIVMIRKSESSNVYKIIKQVDPEAFMSVNSVMGVYGKGFDRIK